LPRIRRAISARKAFIRDRPFAVIALAAVGAAVGLAVKRATENAYLSHATRVAESIGADVAKKAPEPWSRLMRAETLSAADLEALLAAFAIEQAEYRLSGLKVYDLTGRTLYSTDTAEIGDVERNQTLRAVIESGRAGVVRHTEADGTETFELYVPYGEPSRPHAVFELYEPIAGGLQKSIRDSLWPVVGTLSALLALSLLLVVPVVQRAQGAINFRTAAIIEMRQRLERLVSRQAASAMRSNNFADQRRNERVDLTRSTRTFAISRRFARDRSRRMPSLSSIGSFRSRSRRSSASSRRYRQDHRRRHPRSLRRAGREQRAIAAAQALQRRLMSSGLPLRRRRSLLRPVVAGLLGSEGRLISPSSATASTSPPGFARRRMAARSSPTRRRLPAQARSISPARPRSI
jgi:hypothetical protein